MFKNYTPHTVAVHDGNETLSFPSVGVARVSSVSNIVDRIDGVNFYASEYGDVEGLPPVEEGVFIIVSRVVQGQCSDRRDLVVPCGLVRDASGNVIGCQGFER
jgi:hypothetical protein